MSRVPGQPLESVVEARFTRAVKELGGMSIKLVSEAGQPDRLVLLPGGGTRLVELKKADGRTRPIQAVWHRKAERLGHHVDVLQGMEGVASWTQALLREGAYYGEQR